MNIGSSIVKSLCIGSAEASKAYFGSQLAWEKKSDEYWGLCFTAETAGATIALTRGESAPTATVVTSFDGKTWTPYTIGRNITLAAIGDKVYFAAGDSGNTQFARLMATTHAHKFTINGQIAATGSIMSLLDRDDENLRAFSASYVFSYLFDGCTSLTTAPSLPATVLASQCYSCMFQGCTSLVQAPELPAMTLASQCYWYMFQGCTSLTTAPALPATTLASNCYNSMFYGCTSLTQAPELPATTLANDCYRAMFHECTSLVQAPTLPATTLASNCYYQMFLNCTSLTQAPALPATKLITACYRSMFQDCTSLTTAPALPATELGYTCYYGMFNGCTSLTTAPALPATRLANNCYRYMFQGCTSLTQAPDLPAITTFANNCCVSMFNRCTSLASIKVGFTAWGTSTQMADWLNNVSASGTFTCPTELGTDETIERGTSRCPAGWTVVNT